VRLRPLTSRVNRLPIRVRIIVGFVLAMTVLLIAAGSFVYWRVRIDLDTGLDRDLSEQADGLQALIGPDGLPSGEATPDDVAPRTYQVLSADRKVIASTQGVGSTPLLDAGQLSRALDHAIHVELGNMLPASPHPLRLLATSLGGQDAPRVLVVSVQRDQRDEALRELLATLGLAGLGTLIVASFVGDRISKAALAPVETYRRQAVQIAGGATGMRLDVPDGRNDEITRLGSTFNDVLSALERALDRERSFVNDASHELRTPLTLLSARVQLLRRRQRSVVEHETALLELETDIHDLVTLSEHLLALGSAEEADRTIVEHCDLVHVVRQMDLPAVGAELHVVPGELVVAMAPMHVRQIVNNLIANAREHGAPPINLEIHSPSKGLAALTVSDSGEGMPAEFLLIAAERFTRGDSARTRRGSGLGLAVVNAIVRRHDGELRVCSAGQHHRLNPVFDTACSHPSDGTHVTIILQLRTGATP
jgi:two-component system, OmpR family, sensor kinase